MLPSLCSFSYDADKMAIIKEDINSLNSYSQDCVINFSDVVDAVAELKRGKNDGYAGLLLYHFINGCDELFVHISLLFSCMLVHGFAFDDISNMLHVLMVLHKMVAIHIW